MKISWHTTTVFALATATTVAVGWCVLDAPYQQDWRHVLMLMAVWLLVPYVNLLLGLLRSNRVSYGPSFIPACLYLAVIVYAAAQGFIPQRDGRPNPPVGLIFSVFLFPTYVWWVVGGWSNTVRTRFVQHVVFLAVFATLLLVYRAVPSVPRRALPPTASEIQEYFSPAFGGDYILLIKARLPWEDLALYARNLGLRSHFGTSNDREGPHPPPACGTTFPMAPAWWDAPEDADIAECYHDTFAEVPLEVGITWANGYVYYGAMSW